MRVAKINFYIQHSSFLSFELLFPIVKHNHGLRRELEVERGIK